MPVSPSEEGWKQTKDAVRHRGQPCHTSSQESGTVAKSGCLLKRQSSQPQANRC